MVKLADLIKTALNEVGCEELPSGCDDISVDPSFIENNICNNDQQSVSFHQRLSLKQKFDSKQNLTYMQCNSINCFEMVDGILYSN